MWLTVKKEFKILTKLQFQSFLKINELKLGDPKKKIGKILTLFSYVLIGGLLSALSLKMATENGFSNLVVMLAGNATLIIFILTVVKAGNTIFSIESYEKLITLPFKHFNIILSRFIGLYLKNFFIALVIILPGIEACAENTMISPFSWVLIILGIFLVPLIPNALAALIGFIALTTTTKMRHRNTFSLIIHLLLFILLIIPIYIFLFSKDIAEIIGISVQRMGTEIGTAIRDGYPPAAWFAEGVVNGNLLPYLLFAGISVLVAALLVFIFETSFQKISAALQEQAVDKKFVLSAQQETKCSKNLFKIEMKRFFGNNTLVLSTFVGHIMIVLIGIAVIVLGIIGISKINEMYKLGGKEFMEVLINGMPQILPIILPFIPIIPLMIGLFATISLPSASAISIEGNRWWILKTMPIPFIKIVNAKIRVTLTIGLITTIFASFAAILTWCGILAFIGLPMSAPMIGSTIPTMLLLILYPVAIIVFTAYLGIFMNIKFPSLDWEDAVSAVKHGPSVIIMLIVSLGLTILTGLLNFIIFKKFPIINNINSLDNISGMGITDIIKMNITNVGAMGIVTILMIVGTIFLYRKLTKIDVLTIE
ncbi:MAG TPA: hypothetical protein O0X32_01580 [Methanocorpusculum sp.]|nr:hypothetical protein [Methanocorpusculum sp.]